MIMKRMLVSFAAALTLFGCAAIHKNQQNPYGHRLFIEQFLDPRNPLQITPNLSDGRCWHSRRRNDTFAHLK